MKRLGRGPVALLSSLALFAASGAGEGLARGADTTMTECFSANERSIDLQSNHLLREARNQSSVCASSSCAAVVRAACQKRVAALTLAIPTLVFEAKDAAGNDLSQVAVTMDGKPFAERLDGTALDADPGDHVFSFVAAGQPKVDKHVILYEGEKGRRVRIQLGTPEGSPPLAAESRRGTQRLIGLAVGGAGVAGIVVGSVFGLLTFSAWSSAGSACGPGGTKSCAPSGQTAADGDESTAHRDGTISTVAFVAGGALAATGLVVFLTGGRHANEESPAPTVSFAPSLGPGGAGCALSGAF